VVIVWGCLFERGRAVENNLPETTSSSMREPSFLDINKVRVIG